MNKHMLNQRQSLGQNLRALLPAGSMTPDYKLGTLSFALNEKHPLGKLRAALGFQMASKIPGMAPECPDTNKLGIRMEQDIRREDDSLVPEYPLLASCYSRFGLIRLSGKHHSSLCKGGK
ncbi:MAG: hypothetical protein JEZ02_08000 [Desulfatibacillum sp.]|nr:hypothetical protein [Desulfatibacillum sp.]